MENQIVIQSPAGKFQAYISWPSKLPAPAIVVLQELFGVNLLISQYLCIIGCFCGPVCWLLCRRTTLLREETREAVGFF
jgi:hypothetical protein